MTDLKPRRSALYLPASNQKAIEKARQLPCDVVILDLEDAVAPEAKAIARDNAVEALRLGGFGRREVIVRVNALASEWGEEDLQALARRRPDAVLLPKVSSASDVVHAGAYLDSSPMWAMVETPMAIFHLAEIAAVPEVQCLVVGTNDLGKELMARPGHGRRAFTSHLAATVAAARAHGIAAIDGVFNDLQDLTGLAAECEQGADFGFDGKTLIHPGQIETCNRIFSPSSGHVAWATQIVAAFSEPENRGKGAIKIDGKMAELLHLTWAERVLAISLRATDNR